MATEKKNQIIEGCGMHHISIQTRDWAASLKLYQDVLGMELVHQFGSTEKPMALLDIGDGSYIELVAPGPDVTKTNRSLNAHPLLHFALTTTNIEAAVEQVRKEGYEVISEPRRVNLSGLIVTFAFFRGPNGEEIEFFQTHSG